MSDAKERVVLAFRLKLPGTEKLSGLRAVSTSFRVHGMLRLEGDVLTLQWGGAVRIQDVSPLRVQDNREVLPDERIAVPVRLLYRATLAGGWWRPRLELQASELGALAAVPSEQSDIVQLWYARGDHTAALAMATAINDAIAAVSPRT